MTRHPGADARAARLALDGLTPIDCSAAEKFYEWAHPAACRTDLGGKFDPTPNVEARWVDDVGRTVLIEWTWLRDAEQNTIDRYECEHYGRAEQAGRP